MGVGIPVSAPRLRPEFVLAWSESRLDAGDVSRPTLALWRPDGVTVALGLSQTAEKEVEVEVARRDGVGVVRRQSGGGAVLLYPGVLCWEAWAGVERVAAEAGGQGGIRPSYAFLTRPVVEGLRTLGLEVFAAGISDLSLRHGNEEAPRKLAGTAQLRRRDAVLVHGSLLVAPDLDRLGEYLRAPSEQPEYRQGRRHRDFCLTIRDALGGGDESGEALERRVAEAIAAAAMGLGWEMASAPEAATPAMAKLIADKYGSADWNWRRLRKNGDKP